MPVLLVQDGGSPKVLETLPYIPTEDKDDLIDSLTKLPLEPFRHVWVLHQGQNFCPDRHVMVLSNAVLVTYLFSL